MHEKSRLALQFDLAIREYVAETVRPFAQSHTEDDTFIPEVMSTSFVARSVFDKVRQEFPDYVIKFSSDNPRNPHNQASPEELELIEYFNRNPDANTWSGKITLKGQLHMGLFSARRMKEACLQCHGDPQDAPASLLARYGDQAGFHRPVGEVVALDALAMPVYKHRAAATKRAVQAFSVVAAGMILLLLTVYYTFQHLVGRRLSGIASHFQSAIVQEDKVVIRHLSCEHRDEIGDVIESFNLMADKIAASTTSVEHLNAANAKLKLSQDELQLANQLLNNNDQKLRENMQRLMRFNRLATERELKMQELKREVNSLLAELGRSQKYRDKVDIAEIYHSRYSQAQGT